MSDRTLAGIAIRRPEMQAAASLMQPGAPIVPIFEAVQRSSSLTSADRQPSDMTDTAEDQFEAGKIALVGRFPAPGPAISSDLKVRAARNRPIDGSPAAQDELSRVRRVARAQLARCENHALFRSAAMPGWSRGWFELGAPSGHDDNVPIRRRTSSGPLGNVVGRAGHLPSPEAPRRLDADLRQGAQYGPARSSKAGRLPKPQVQPPGSADYPSAERFNDPRGAPRILPLHTLKDMRL